VKCFLLIVLAATVAGCTTGTRPPPDGPSASAGAPITIGVLAGLTGQGAVDAAEIHLNVDLAIVQANAAGGIVGHPLQAAYADTHGDQALATRLARQLVEQDHAAVLIGGVLSAECLALEQAAASLEVVYLTASGCPAVALTAGRCSKYTFRILPAAPQLIAPLARYVTNVYGNRWAILYPDYAFGQAQARTYETALAASGASPPLEIAIPLGEQDPAPYVARIPIDGTIDGIINAENGADLTAVDLALRQSGNASHLPVVFSGGKEQFGGTYPDSVDGFLFSTVHVSNLPADMSADDRAYATAFAEQVTEQPQLAALLGGPTRAVSGALGYQTYATISALRQTMLATHFTSRSDTQRLIAALETFAAPAGADFPGGAIQMNRADHQGTATVYIARVAGQTVEILQSVPPGDVPPIGTCRV